MNAAGPDAPADAPVKVWKQGSLGRLRLNRPAALNALTLDMVRRMDAALSTFAADPGVAAVVLDGEGPRALCAGGDIRALYDSGRANDGAAAQFWMEEYRLNARIACYAKPYVALQSGIMMGGGVGVSAHARHRVVTETTVMAMPEVGIGFIPDVGGSWLLAKAPGQLGLVLGLSGERFGGADAIYAGFADLLIPQARLADAVAALAELPVDAGHAGVDSVLQSFAQVPEPGPWQQCQAQLDPLFAGGRAEHILARLDAAGSDHSSALAATLRKKSPTSIKLTLHAIASARAGLAQPGAAAGIPRGTTAAGRA